MSPLPPDPPPAPRRAAQALLLDVVLLGGPLALVPLLLRLDARYFDLGRSERSLTEFAQAGLIGCAALAYLLGGLRQPAVRGYALAGATLFGCMFIRENDAVLDAIFHGAWLYPALGLAALGGLFVWRARSSVLAPLVAHAGTRHGTLVLVGLMLLLVFSRLFGTGSLWEPLLGDAYDPKIKMLVQEGIELAGYAVLTQGAVGAALTRFGRSDDR